MKEIVIRDAAFSYDGKTDVFSGLNDTISSDEIFCILGPNGIGKSTLLKAILNLHKLKSGSICLDGKNVTAYRPAELARVLAYIPQTYSLAFPYKVLDMVLMGRMPYLNSMARPTPEDYEKCGRAIEILGLRDLADRPCTQLSGGQLQLVMLARAIAQEAEFIILDEPTSHLDYGKQMVTLEMIREMKARGVGIIMTTHDPDHAFMVCDKAAVMAKGHFIAVGKPDDVVTEENLRTAYGVDVRLITYRDENGREQKTCVPGSRGSRETLFGPAAGSPA